MATKTGAKLEALLTRKGATLGEWIRRQIAEADTPAGAPARAKATRAQANDAETLCIECVAERAEAVRDATRQALAEYARVAEEGAWAMTRLALLEAVAGPAVRSLTRIVLNPKQAGHSDV